MIFSIPSWEGKRKRVPHRGLFGGHVSSSCRVSGGVGFRAVGQDEEPTPACGHPSKEGSFFSIPSWEGCRASGGVGLVVGPCPEPTPALRATPPGRGAFLLSPLGRGAALAVGWVSSWMLSRNPPRPCGPPLQGGDRGSYSSPASGWVASGFRSADGLALSIISRSRWTRWVNSLVIACASFRSRMT